MDRPISKFSIRYQSSKFGKVIIQLFWRCGMGFRTLCCQPPLVPSLSDSQRPPMPHDGGIALRRSSKACWKRWAQSIRARDALNFIRRGWESGAELAADSCRAFSVGTQGSKIKPGSFCSLTNHGILRGVFAACFIPQGKGGVGSLETALTREFPHRPRSRIPHQFREFTTALANLPHAMAHVGYGSRDS